MKQNDITWLLSRRGATARNPIIRCFLNLHVQQQRIHAEWLAHGADATKHGIGLDFRGVLDHQAIERSNLDVLEAGGHGLEH